MTRTPSPVSRAATRPTMGVRRHFSFVRALTFYGYTALPPLAGFVETLALPIGCSSTLRSGPRQSFTPTPNLPVRRSRAFEHARRHGANFALDTHRLRPSLWVRARHVRLSDGDSRDTGGEPRAVQWAEASLAQTSRACVDSYDGRKPGGPETRSWIVVRREQRPQRGQTAAGFAAPRLATARPR